MLFGNNNGSFRQISLGFTSCNTCSGNGFLKKGEHFPYHFDKCIECKGLGQAYNESIKERVPIKK